MPHFMGVPQKVGQPLNILYMREKIEKFTNCFLRCPAMFTKNIQLKPKCDLIYEFHKFYQYLCQKTIGVRVPGLALPTLSKKI